MEAPPHFEDGTVQSGGFRLSYSRLRPQASKATLVILHGLNDHKGRYRQLQEELAAAGYASMAYDQRGFGRSEGRRTDVADYHDLLDDLKTLVDLAQAEAQEKVVVLGHSLGGAVAAAFFIASPEAAEALVLSSPAYDFPGLPMRLELLTRLLSRIVPRVSIRYPSVGNQRSRDPTIDIAVANDPLIFREGTPRFYREFRKMNRLVHEEASKITAPTLILQAGADKIVRPEGAKDLYRQLKHPKSKLIGYEGYYHEVFHDIGRGRVVSDLIAWLATVIP